MTLKRLCAGYYTVKTEIGDVTIMKGAVGWNVETAKLNWQYDRDFMVETLKEFRSMSEKEILELLKH